MIDSSNSDDGSVDIKFSHIQLYVDSLLSVTEYLKLASSLTKFDEAFSHDTPVDIAKGRELWNSIQGIPEEFVPHGRDVVKQLIAGFGFRVTGCYPDVDTNSTACSTNILVTSSDPNGTQILVTSKENDRGGIESSDNNYLHFGASNVDQFYHAHSNRQGIAVLAFEVGIGWLDQIFNRYSELHPNLVPTEYKEGAKVYDNEARVLEVYAYYEEEKKVSNADEGTRLRFVEPIDTNTHQSNCKCILPGISSLSAEFGSSQPAYFDHWVSNVVCRTGFLDTLEDVLSFTPKVDFNAGVVAAGEAQIESTVTGNTSTKTSDGKDSALKDQSQIYLPINNAITKVGHVHGFLQELGQGVQHIASRVGNIIDFIEQANNRRKIFGEGFTFLNIPRSYYGILSKDMLMKGLHPNSKEEEGLLSSDCATAIYDICVSEGLLHDDSSLNLDVSEDSAAKLIDLKIPALNNDEYLKHREEVIRTIMRSRYVNLYSLLRDHLSEDSYVAIVRNQILVDVQGEDLLFQIFTSNILQRKSGDEAPFFEFIQRVCSECKGPDGCTKEVKPGCGGFGIRNFLTLFLSIEVTKAWLEAANTKANNDSSGYAYAQQKIQLFTDQLNESNPLLTSISDAMTREGIARDNIAASTCQEEKKEGCDKWKLEMEKQSLAKARGNEKLMECNMKYQTLMKALRESQAV